MAGISQGPKAPARRWQWLLLLGVQVHDVLLPNAGFVLEGN